MSVFFSGPDIYCTALSLSSQTPPLHSFPICGTRMNILHTDCGNARWLCGNGVCADPCVRINDEAKWALAEQNKVQGKLAKAVNVCRVDLISIHHSVSLWATLVFNLNYNFQVPSNQGMAFSPPIFQEIRDAEHLHRLRWGFQLVPSIILKHFRTTKAGKMGIGSSLAAYRVHSNLHSQPTLCDWHHSGWPPRTILGGFRFVMVSIDLDCKEEIVKYFSITAMGITTVVP